MEIPSLQELAYLEMFNFKKFFFLEGGCKFTYPVSNLNFTENNLQLGVTSRVITFKLLGKD